MNRKQTTEVVQWRRVGLIVQRDSTSWYVTAAAESSNEVSGLWTCGSAGFVFAAQKEAADADLQTSHPVNVIENDTAYHRSH